MEATSNLGAIVAWSGFALAIISGSAATLKYQHWKLAKEA